MIQKYQIGDIVDAGEIIRICHPRLFLMLSMLESKQTEEEAKARLDKTWGPEWYEHPVYMLGLNEPTRQMSYEDWLFQVSNLNWYKPEFYREIYEAIIPLRNTLDIPEHLVEKQILGVGGFGEVEEHEEN